MSEAQGLHLDVGDRVQLELVARPHLPRLAVRVIGRIDGVSLLITHPARDGKLVGLRDGEPVIGRAFSDGHFVAFETSVLRTAPAPVPYVHLKLPRRMEQMRIRRAPRVPVRLPCAIAVEGGAERRGEIVDLSVDGAQLLLTDALDVGAQVAVAMAMRLGKLADHGVRVSAVVRSVQERDGGSWSHGLQFVEVPQAAGLLLRAFIYEQLHGDTDAAADEAA